MLQMAPLARMAPLAPLARIAPLAPTVPIPPSAGAMPQAPPLPTSGDLYGVAAVARHVVVDGGVRLHVVEAGPADGPLVLLLHGFPEFWYAWHRQIAPLAAAGHRVLVPDLRGYGLSDKPRGVGSYRMDRLAADVAGLIGTAGRERASVVGHDWGGALAWWLAADQPERIDRLAVLNVPHPAVMRRHLLRNPAQRRRSWYIFFFQLPWLPELWLRRRDWAIASRMLVALTRRGVFDQVMLARYRAAWRQRGELPAATAMIHWYRAAMRRPARPRQRRVTVRTRVIWGVLDRALGRELVPDSLALCDAGEAVYLDGAGHFVQHEEPERVTELLLEHLPRA